MCYVLCGSVSCLFAFALLAHSLLPRERKHAAVFLLCVLDKLMEISGHALLCPLDLFFHLGRCRVVLTPSDALVILSRSNSSVRMFLMLLISWMISANELDICAVALIIFSILLEFLECGRG